MTLSLKGFLYKTLICKQTKLEPPRKRGEASEPRPVPLRLHLPQRDSTETLENQYPSLVIFMVRGWGASSLLLGEVDPYPNLETVGLGGMHTLKKFILKQPSFSVTFNFSFICKFQVI